MTDERNNASNLNIILARFYGKAWNKISMGLGHIRARLGISIYISELQDFIPLVFVTDNEDCADLLELMFRPALPWVPVVFVDESDLEIRARVTVVLNVPVEGAMPDETEVTIPSFNMKLRGGGRLEWIEETTVLPDYTMWVGAWACSANGVIIIDGCEYQIGEASVGHYMMTITENP